MLIAERRRIPELAAAHDEITATKRERNRAVIRRAIDRGELRADADPELVIDMYVSPVLYRFLVTDLPLDAKFASNVVTDRRQRLPLTPPGFGVAQPGYGWFSDAKTSGSGQARAAASRSCCSRSWIFTLPDAGLALAARATTAHRAIAGDGAEALGDERPRAHVRRLLLHPHHLVR